MMTTDPAAPTWQWRGPDAAKAAARYRERYHAEPPQPEERRDHQGVTLAFEILTHNSFTVSSAIVTNDTMSAGQMRLELE